MRILVAANPGSIHATRFVGLLQELGYDVRLFHSEEHYVQEEHLTNTVVYVAAFHLPPVNGNVLRVNYPFEMEYRGRPGFARRLRQGLARLRHGSSAPPSRARALVRVLRGWKPHIVFSLKMQDDGYTVSEARDALGGEFAAKWVHFSWGTDIEFFGKHPDYARDHLPRIKRLLAHCDFHLADTKRDIDQAQRLGFGGVSLGVFPAHGGFDLETLAAIRRAATGDRDVILVKGREGGLVGRAFNVLAALQRIPDLADRYRIKVMMPSPEVSGAAAFLSRFGGLRCEILPRLAYRDLLALYARSRIAIAATDVDGAPSFLLEAMAMGALPIHSDMESIREWVTDGRNGLLFPVHDVDALVACLRRALTDEALVESARRGNAEITDARLDRRALGEHLREMIHGRVLAEAPAPRW